MSIWDTVIKKIKKMGEFSKFGGGGLPNLENSKLFFFLMTASLSFCLGFANHVGQTNKLKIVHTFQCTLYKVHYVPYRSELSTPKTSQGRGKCEKFFYD